MMMQSWGNSLARKFLKTFSDCKIYLIRAFDCQSASLIGKVILNTCRRLQTGSRKRMLNKFYDQGTFSELIMNPGCPSSIFNIIRQEVRQHALKLARSIEKSTYKLEAHHHHLNFTHRALENRWLSKSLRFSPPVSRPVFRTIMERATTHCMRAKISIPHKNVVAEIEATIGDLPDESKDAIRASAAKILRCSNPPKHKNTTAAERKALEGLTKDKTRVVSKKEYDEKMQILLSDPNTYNKVTKLQIRKLNVH